MKIGILKTLSQVKHPLHLFMVQVEIEGLNGCLNYMVTFFYFRDTFLLLESCGLNGICGPHYNWF